MASSSIKEALRGKKVPLGASVPKVWEPVIIALLDEMSKLPEWDDIQIVQIKAKFGELRFYYDGARSEKISELISKAALMCENTYVWG